MRLKLLGVDARRDIAALKISAVGLIGSSSELPWSVATGTLAAYRMADELPGGGKRIQIAAGFGSGRFEPEWSGGV